MSIVRTPTSIHNFVKKWVETGWNIYQDIIYCDFCIIYITGSVAERLERLAISHASYGGFEPHPGRSIFFLKYVIFLSYFSQNLDYFDC